MTLFVNVYVSLKRYFGDDWYRQERISVCKHVGARLFTPLSNDDQNTNGDNNFALAA